MAVCLRTHHEERTGRLTKHEQKIIYSFARSMCLSDHMGDAWDDVRKLFELLGLKFYEDDERMPSFEGFEEAGAVSMYELKKEKCTPKTQSSQRN